MDAMTGMKRTVRAAACVSVFFAVAAPAALGHGGEREKFRDKQAAAAAGDPSASAPVFAAPEEAYFEGRKISGDEIERRGLGCLQESDRLTCTDKAAPKPHVNRARGESPKARAAYHIGCGGDSLIQWDGAGYDGSYVTLIRRHAWYDLPSYMNNDVSSYNMQNHSGHMSDYGGGGGYWYPGPTNCGDHQNIPYHYPSWDQRISSRYRN